MNLSTSDIGPNFLGSENLPQVWGGLYVVDSTLIEDWEFVSESTEDLRRLRCFRSATCPELILEVHIQDAGAAGVSRFQLRLTGPGKLISLEEKFGIDYLKFGLESGATVTEIALANYDHQVNQYRPSRTDHPPEKRFDGQRFHAPIVIVSDENNSTLMAYEHGGDHPNPFLAFEASAGSITLRGLEGNYAPGQVAVHISPWFLIASGENTEAVMKNLRQYLLLEHGPEASRAPSIFYNTWNHQERLKYLQGQPYLSQMNLERILKEIDVAHELGIEVFVIDTGWYQKTGDWEVNLERFPDGLKQVRARLEGNGMRLGLWFNPIVAAKTSTAFLEHPEWVMERNGKPHYCGPIWETEESYGMCLCSGWADHFAETLIRLNRELGVTYFKWDAVNQWGCESAEHDHGNHSNTLEERKANYAFESGRRLTQIAEKVGQACPGIVVDFDVTEGGRYFGLGFLSAGKYFLVNNGPYYSNFDIPREFVREPDTINVFFHPGPSRPRVCRGGYRFDSVIPASLFLTHYLPDGDEISLTNSFVSLVLGGNGIWGSLPELGPSEREFWSTELARYKRVRDAASRAYPVVTGDPGLSPEIHEKIDPLTGEGLIAFFTITAGTYTYVTQPLSMSPRLVEVAEEWEVLPNGALKVVVRLPKNGAAVVTIES